ncbi:MAG: hypothetical protein P8144_08920 [Gammaproteobacteria bacterium]
MIKTILPVIFLLFLSPIWCYAAAEGEPDEGGIGGTGHGLEDRPDVNDEIFNRPEIPSRVGPLEIDRPESLNDAIMSVPSAVDTDGMPQSDQVPERPTPE